MSYRIAIASSDGESVNQHFGQARNLLVYEIDDDNNVNFIEDREINLISDEAAHTDRNMHIFAEALNDCSAVFVRRIGAQSAKYLHSRNIRTFEVNFSLNHIFTTLIYQQIRGRVRLFQQK
jgi:predicted Fe-Mo cluster-binding NifX family protein